MPFSRFFHQELVRELRMDWARPDLLSVRYPFRDRKVAPGAILHVRPEQIAQSVYRGEYGDQFGPGQHSLTKETLPMLNRLSIWPYGAGQPFQFDLYFVNTGLIRNVPFRTYQAVFWGNVVHERVPIRFAGDFDAQIIHPRRFLTEVAGAEQAFHVGEFSDSVRLRIVNLIIKAARDAHISLDRWRREVADLGAVLLPVVAEAARTEYGFDVPRLHLNELTLPPEIETKLSAAGS